MEHIFQSSATNLVSKKSTSGFEETPQTLTRQDLPIEKPVANCRPQLISDGLTQSTPRPDRFSRGALVIISISIQFPFLEIDSYDFNSIHHGGNAPTVSGHVPLP
jgi:hypothetical protein